MFLEQRWWNGGSHQNVGRHSCDVIIHVMSSYMWCHPTCDVILHVMWSYMWFHPTCDIIKHVMSSYMWYHAYARCHHTCDVIKLMFYLQQRWWNGGTHQNVGRHSCDVILCGMSSYVWCQHMWDVIICVMSSYVWRNIYFTTASSKWGHSSECWRTWRERRTQMKHQQMWRNFSGKA